MDRYATENVWISFVQVIIEDCRGLNSTGKRFIPFRLAVCLSVYTFVCEYIYMYVCGWMDESMDVCIYVHVWIDGCVYMCV